MTSALANYATEAALSPPTDSLPIINLQPFKEWNPEAQLAYTLPTVVRLLAHASEFCQDSNPNLITECDKQETTGYFAVAIPFADKACRSVAMATIQNCFRPPGCCASDVVFDFCAHAHIGDGGEEGGAARIMTLIQPNPEMQLRIRTELNEDVSTRNQDLEHIKEWVSKQPHLPQFQDDGRLMTFLRGCKFSLEKTKRKLDMYFTMRAAIPEFFSNRDVNRKELQDILSKVPLQRTNVPCFVVGMTTQFGNYRTFTETPDVHDIREQVTTLCQPVPYRTAKVRMDALSTIRPRLHIPPLPGLTPNGRRVIVMQGITKDIIPANVADGMKLVLMIGDIRLKEELTGVAGDVYILDASVATAAHFAKFTPSIVKKFLVCVQIFCHPDGFESLYKYIPQEILPSEYGGYAGPIDVIHREWVKKLDSYTDWFKEQEDIKADESKRPGKPKTHDDLFGLEAEFDPIPDPPLYRQNLEMQGIKPETAGSVASNYDH
uniref:CRAL-TRIO domain-containing protein n=1 Tax=Timema shepardi TaxID=629360 RepID=A0A7R9G142_TIMSH|nr:unnamed protein product [Timema shepardi]